MYAIRIHYNFLIFLSVGIVRFMFRRFRPFRRQHHFGRRSGVGVILHNQKTFHHHVEVSELLWGTLLVNGCFVTGNKEQLFWFLEYRDLGTYIVFGISLHVILTFNFIILFD